MAETHRVQVNYKSGKSMIFTVEEFNVKYKGQNLTEVGWEIPAGGVHPLFMGIGDIESVWQL